MLWAWSYFYFRAGPAFFFGWHLSFSPYAGLGENFGQSSLKSNRWQELSDGYSSCIRRERASAAGSRAGHGLTLSRLLERNCLLFCKNYPDCSTLGKNREFACLPSCPREGQYRLCIRI